MKCTLHSLALLLVCAACPRTPTVPDRADLVLVGGRVFTGDPTRPWTDALAIRDGRVIALGDDARRMSATCTRELGGKLVIPGINDAHVHEPVLFAPVEVDRVAALAEAVSANPPGTWLRAPLDVDDPNITRDALDAIAPHHPVWLDNSTGHVVVLNTVAEHLLGLAATPPTGGFVDKPGWHSEYARYAAMRVRARDASDADIEAAVRQFEEVALAYGITTVQTFPLDVDAERLARVLAASPRRLRWHVRRVPIGGVIVPPRAEPPDPTAHVLLAGTKYFLDGTQVERGAALTEPYTDAATRTGRLDWRDADVRTMLTNARAAGDALHVHAVGDRAIHQLLDAMDALAGTWRDSRIVLEHGDALVAGDLARLVADGVVVVQNPYHGDPSLPNHARLGDRRWMPLRSLVAAGVHLAFGSDGPLNPFANIARAEAHGGEALSREQALVAYTSGSAYVERLEASKGRLVPGMVADLAVLGDNLFETTDLAAMRSVLTVIGGEIVLGRPCP